MKALLVSLDAEIGDTTGPLMSMGTGDAVGLAEGEGPRPVPVAVAVAVMGPFGGGVVDAVVAVEVEVC